MRLFRFGCLLAITFVALSRPALAQEGSPAHRDAVKQLLAVSHIREITDQTVDAMLKQQVQETPDLAPYAKILSDFYREVLNWNTLEPEYTRLYMEVFTEAEVREMTTFYQTPLGQKLLTKMPLLMTKSNELASRRVQAAMPQLMQRLQTAMEAKTAAPADH
jgi:uncharacterized protein